MKCSGSKTLQLKWRPLEGFINRLDTAEERISELKDMSIENSKMEKQREEIWNKTEYSRTVGQSQMVQHMYNGDTRGEERMEQKKYMKSVIQICLGIFMSYILFCYSVCLSLYQYHIISVTLCKSWNQIMWVLHYFFFKIFLGIIDLISFNISFRMCLPVPTTKARRNSNWNYIEFIDQFAENCCHNDIESSILWPWYCFIYLSLC